MLVASVGLVALFPFLAIIGVLLRVYHGRPILFRQWRPGRSEVLFPLLKFRTMLDTHDAMGQPLPDSNRLTRLGACLRKTSLDELPELWNVLRGEMSLVGPRPLLPEYLPFYTERERLRHTVRPGLTGLAQVSGRNFLGWDERLELDVKYVENWSLLLDFRILARTCGQVIFGRGVIVLPGQAQGRLDVIRHSGNLHKVKAAA